MLIKTFRIRGPTEHWTHDVTVKIDPSNPDLATGLVLGHAQTSPDGVVSNAAMRFKDQYRREGGLLAFCKKNSSLFVLGACLRIFGGFESNTPRCNRRRDLSRRLPRETRSLAEFYRTLQWVRPK